jgi:two-component system, sensor histidine kinase LadS
MSIMGSTLLNRIVIEERIHSPNTILLKLHKYIQIMLQQDTSKNTDGMDLSLCCFEIQDANIKDIKLTFSGAKSDVVFIKDDKISILKGDRNSIGGTYQNDENSFHNQTVYLNKGDSLYLFTDGFADTCNEKRKKFGEQKLKNLIFEHKSLSMILQQQVFLSALYEFKNNAEQRDDITLFGIRL